MLDVLGGKQIPVFLLTGFLGSGKTTLLNALLHSGAISETAIVVNEFAELGIDQLLIRQVDEHLVLLNAGCVCCSIREDLLQALRELFVDQLKGKVSPFKRVLIETSGISDPVPIVHTLLTDPFLRERFMLGGTITAIDACQPVATLCQRPEGLRQAAIADCFVVTKKELADPERLERVEQELSALNPQAWTCGNGPAGIAELAAFILSGGVGTDRQPQANDWQKKVAESRRVAGGPSGLLAPRKIGPHAANVTSFLLHASGAFRWEEFVEWIQQMLTRTPEGVLRIKGFVHVEGAPLPVLVQGVRHVFYPSTSLAAWPDDGRDSRLVLILENPRHLSPRALLEAALPACDVPRWTDSTQGRPELQPEPVS